MVPGLGLLLRERCGGPRPEWARLVLSAVDTDALLHLGSEKGPSREALPCIELIRARHRRENLFLSCTIHFWTHEIRDRTWISYLPGRIAPEPCSCLINRGFSR